MILMDKKEQRTANKVYRKLRFFKGRALDIFLLSMKLTN